MKMKTADLLRQCRDALLQQSNEYIAAQLTQWFEDMIGEEGMEEELDDLCLLLNYRVQSWGSQISFATYTSWWEVEGSRAPSAGTFLCPTGVSLRQRLLDMPIKQFGLVLDLAYQARSKEAELAGEAPLPTGLTLLREMAVWLAGPLPTSLAERRALSRERPPFESRKERGYRERERVIQACQQGYLMVFPNTPQVVIDTFRHWCKEHAYPYLWIEPCGLHQARLCAHLKIVGVREATASRARFREQLTRLTIPYLTRAQMQGYQARLTRDSRQQIVLEGLLKEDVEEVAQELITLWSGILSEERQRQAEQDTLRHAVLQPMWKRELKRLREQGQQLELPLLTENVVLPVEWDALFAREKLSTFLAFLESSVRSRDPKAILVQRVGERLNADRTARAQFFEVFKHELAVTPLELESLLKCTPTERKRWTEEGKLPVLVRRSFRKAGRWMLFPIFDRRMILGLPQTELDRWRAEHQALVKEHRKAGARAAAAKVKSLLPGVHSGQARSREDNGS